LHVGYTLQYDYFMDKKINYLTQFLKIIDQRIIGLIELIQVKPDKQKQLALLIVDNERWRVAVKIRLDKILNKQ
jgi:hypothetical protein